MVNPVTFWSLTREQADSAARFHVEHGAQAVVTPDQNGQFSVSVTYPQAATNSSSTGPVVVRPDATEPATDGWSQLLTAYRADNATSLDLKTASLAQWIQESGRGTSPLARLYNNFGGIKFRARMQDYCTPVDYTGTDGDATVYCNFTSPAAFIAGYWHFISTGPTYSGWERFSNDAAGYIRFVAPSYAGDPNYAARVLALFGEARQLLVSGTPSAARPQSFSSDDGSSARVAVIVGHNSRSPGAGAGAPLFKNEFTFNSGVAAFMQAQAAQYNLQIKVIFRSPAANVGGEITAAYRSAAAFDPACIVELHFNSSDDPSATGTEVLLAPGKPAAAALAAAMVKSLKDTLGLTLRGNQGLKVLSQGARGWISVTAQPTIPSVLTEPFFGSNPSDNLAVGTVGEEGLAIAYLRALREFVLDSNLVS